MMISKAATTYRMAAHPDSARLSVFELSRSRIEDSVKRDLRPEDGRAYWKEQL